MTVGISFDLGALRIARYEYEITSQADNVAASKDAFARYHLDHPETPLFSGVVIRVDRK